MRRRPYHEGSEEHFGRRRPVSQRGMWSDGVVVASPAFDQDLHGVGLQVSASRLWQDQPLRRRVGDRLAQSRILNQQRFRDSFQREVAPTCARRIDVVLPSPLDIRSWSWILR